MVPNGAKFYQMVPCQPKWYPMVANGTHCYKMVLKVDKWYQMVLKGTKYVWFGQMAAWYKADK